ncbi:hypothetical protein [Natranaerofaba carboxydovora]|uniref:hypothetical protein n=1 Tax=Natranaerofaba carboxydovora TaxID=2742683 RepID=UPI001F13D574|nr:hypothetical protein [Natranaerofaba carboxydovora]
MWVQCPVCSGIDVGKVSSSNYYCWNCLVEIKYKKGNEAHIYNIQDDGTLESAYKVDLQE